MNSVIYERNFIFYIDQRFKIFSKWILNQIVQSDNLGHRLQSEQACNVKVNDII